MARKQASGVAIKETTRGTVYALRFRAYGERHYVTLGRSTDDPPWTEARVQTELANVLADVRRGIWQPAVPEAAEQPVRRDPTFYEFASEWFAGIELSLGERTRVDYQWRLSKHLLPYFAEHRLSAITVQEVDRYRTHMERERAAAERERNKQLELPVDHVSGCRGRCRAGRSTRRSPPRHRARAGRRVRAHRPQHSAGQEAVAARVEALPCLPATGRRRGAPGGRWAARRAGTAWRGLPPPAAAAVDVDAGRSEDLRGEGIGHVTPHGLRRTFASMLLAARADVPYVMAQLGHTDPKMTLGVYAKVIATRADHGAALDTLLGGASEWVPLGTSPRSVPIGS